MRWLFLLFLASLGAAEIELGGVAIEVEIADTKELRTKGLSGRDSLPDGTGMLFVFKSPIICSFWMKDTKVDLSIGFFDEDKRLLQWMDMPIPKNQSQSRRIYSSAKPVLYALEVPMGWFQKNQIKPGQTFQWINKSFREPDVSVNLAP